MAIRERDAQESSVSLVKYEELSPVSSMDMNDVTHQLGKTYNPDNYIKLEIGSQGVVNNLYASYRTESDDYKLVLSKNIDLNPNYSPSSSLPNIIIQGTDSYEHTIVVNLGKRLVNYTSSLYKSGVVPTTGISNTSPITINAVQVSNNIDSGLGVTTSSRLISEVILAPTSTSGSTIVPEWVSSTGDISLTKYYCDDSEFVAIYSNNIKMLMKEYNIIYERTGESTTISKYNNISDYSFSFMVDHPIIFDCNSNNFTCDLSSDPTATIDLGGYVHSNMHLHTGTYSDASTLLLGGTGVINGLIIEGGNDIAIDSNVTVNNLIRKA